MNTNKFDSKSAVYSKARPNYPKTLFEYFMSENLFADDRICADIGSGTGIFTAQASFYLKKIFAVEPNRDMRTEAEVIYKKYNNIESINGTAENSDLKERSVDIITVAQAFHWFDKSKFKEECKRILKPEGQVILVWNDRDNSTQIIKDNFEVNKKFCPDFKGSSNGIDFSKENFADFFEGEYKVVEFENNLFYNKTDFVNRNLSSSYAPKKDDLMYDRYIESISEVFEKHQVNGTVLYPYVTRCYIGRV